MSTYTYIAKTR